jgi:hypothetical protein
MRMGGVGWGVGLVRRMGMGRGMGRGMDMGMGMGMGRRRCVWFGHCLPEEWSIFLRR